jgi:hypothetical protein
MKALFLLCRVTAVLVLALFSTNAASTAKDSPAGFRLTVDLRDGTRIVGRSGGENLRFQSDVLGDLKLPLEKIRSVEVVGKTNSVRLTTTSGDTLTVRFLMVEIAVEAGFGKVQLPVSSIKTLRVAPLGKPGRPREGLVALWSGEDSGMDSISEAQAVNKNVSFTDGVVGRAFTFSPNSFPYGTYTGMQVADRPEFALTKSLTIEAWVRLRGAGYVIFTRGDNRPGMDPYTLSLGADNNLHFAICDQSGASATISTTLSYYQWTLVTATLDDDTGTMSVYTNGELAVQTQTSVRPMRELQPDRSPGLGLGNVNDGGNNFPFAGDLDEIALYDRALSVDEIRGIYNENAANASQRGEPLPAQNPPGRMTRSYFNGSQGIYKGVDQIIR